MLCCICLFLWVRLISVRLDSSMVLDFRMWIRIGDIFDGC
jgi:hypothetical protein